MATTPASGGELSITVKPSDAAGGELQQSESRSADELVRRKLKTLNKMVFCVVFLEWAGNVAGTLAFIWATVVLLGGFSSVLSRGDFWFATVMTFMEGSSWVYIRKDVSINQWIIFGSTCAFRWKDFSLPRMLVGQTFVKLSVVSIGVGVALVPEFPPEIASSIPLLKVAFLVLISQLLTRLERGSFVHMVLLLLGIACVSGAMYGYVKTAPQRSKTSKHDTQASLKATGLAFAWLFGTMLLTGLVCGILSYLRFMRNPMPLLWFKIFIASALACLPFLQATLASYYRYFSIPAAVTLLMVSNEVFWFWGADDDDSSSGTTSERSDCSPETDKETSEQENTISSSDGLILQIVETILPILFFWSVMFPLPAGLSVSLMLSFYTLLSVIAGVLLANLQIPVAFLQVLLSILRLHSLQGHRQHDYSPLPDGTSPNLVPSVVVFYLLELCEGSSKLLAAILGFISFLRRRSLACDLGYKQEWGAKAISLYFRQAYQARMETGLFHCQDQDQDRHTPASLDSFAIQSLGCTSSREMQIVGLRILHNSLQRGDSQSNKKLITEIVKDAENIITNIIGLISRCYLAVEENSGGLQHHKKIIEQMGQHHKKWTEQMEVARLCLEFVRTIAINGGKISARFRKELSENPFFLDSLDRILNLWGWGVDDLREQVMGIVAALAVDEAARKEIGSNQSIIPNLMHEFEPSMYDDRRSSLRMAAGEALANLTINSRDNCWAILLADPEHNVFITKLIDMLDDEYYICVAANLLHNLCANSRDMLIDLGANVILESALSKAMKIIMTKEGKQLEAALCVASQIGYVIPEYVAQELDSDAAAAEQLVTKLVDTLKSNREPCLEYPRIRRLLVEVVISIVELCPGYIKLFKENGAKDALDMIKGTPSRLEKYRVFLHGEGVVPERLTMRDLVDNAKRLIYEATPTPGW